MEVTVKCADCNGIMEEQRMEKEFTNDAAIFVTPTCDCYKEDDEL